MPQKQEIEDLFNYLRDLYETTRQEQSIDDQYYKDTFAVPQIHSLSRLQRTGRAARLVDAPAEHIITSNPQVFRNPTKDTKEKRESSLAVSRECNRWMGVLKRQNPNPFKECVKNLLLRGETWIHPVHNEHWVVRPINRRGMPVLFMVPDPMIIYADPNEDENGMPERVIVHYDRIPSIVKAKYPEWRNLKGKTDRSRDASLTTVVWQEYWDMDNVIFEADGEVVLDIKNRYGIIPFVHALSGFGKSSPEGKMEDLIVGRLRKVRELLKRECAIVSDIDSIFHLFANRSLDVQPVDDQHEVPPDFAQKYEMGPGLIHTIPPGVVITRSEEIMPEGELFQYLYRISAELEKEDPLVMAGTAVGSTGRQQDMTMGSAMIRYNTILENTEYAFATAIGMGLKMCEKIPTLCPEEFGLSKGDIDENYDVQVALKAADPIEDDRKATLGSRLYQQGEVDLRTNLIQYQGYTEEEAEDIITNILVDKVIFQSPDVAEIIGMKAAEKLGITEELEMVRARRQVQGAGATPGLQQAPGAAEQTQRQGQVNTPMGREMIDEALRTKGQRSAPVAYNRGA